jgi:exopolysaccharide production protein ExoZ
MKNWTSIHFLRGLAASVVVAHHVPQYLEGRVPYRLPALPHGAAGVDVFFIISGFVMYCATQHTQKHWLVFLRDRLARVLPMYWLVTCALSLAVWLVPSAFATFRVSSDYALKSLLFIPVFDAQGYIRPVLAVGWTLYFELSFYLLVAVCLGLFGRAVMSAAALLLASTALLYQLLGLPERHSSWQLLSPIILEFALGICLAYAAHTRRVTQLRLPLRATLAPLFLAAGLTAIILVEPRDFSSRLLFWGTGSFLTVGATVLMERELSLLRPRLWLLERLGDASYVMYLIHGVLFSLLWKLTPGALKLMSVGAFLVLLLGPIAASLPTHVLIERPLNRLVARWLARLWSPSGHSVELAHAPSE